MNGQYNNNVEVFRLALRKYNVNKPMLTKQIAYVAEQFFKASFRKQEGGGKKWKSRLFEPPGKQRAILMGRGTLRNSITGTSNKNRAIVSSKLPYAAIHNDGGTINITPKMRRFFWAMYYKTMKGATSNAKTSLKTKKTTYASSSLLKASKLYQDALPWKLLAMHKGNTLKIPQRQFMYHSTELNSKIDRYIDKFIKSIQ